MWILTVLSHAAFATASLLNLHSEPLAIGNSVARSVGGGFEPLSSQKLSMRRLDAMENQVQQPRDPAGGDLSTNWNEARAAIQTSEQERENANSAVAITEGLVKAAQNSRVPGHDPDDYTEATRRLVHGHNILTAEEAFHAAVKKLRDTEWDLNLANQDIAKVEAQAREADQCKDLEIPSDNTLGVMHRRADRVSKTLEDLTQKLNTAETRLKDLEPEADLQNLTAEENEAAVQAALAEVEEKLRAAQAADEAVAANAEPTATIEEMEGGEGTNVDDEGLFEQAQHAVGYH